MAIAIGSVVDLREKDLISCLLHFINESFIISDHSKQCISAILSVAPLIDFANISKSIRKLFCEEKKIILLKVIRHFFFQKQNLSEVSILPKKYHLFKWLSSLLKVIENQDNQFMEILSEIQKKLLYNIHLSESLKSVAVIMDNVEIIKREGNVKLKHEHENRNFFEIQNVKYI